MKFEPVLFVGGPLDNCVRTSLRAPSFAVEGRSVTVIPWFPGDCRSRYSLSMDGATAYFTGFQR